MLLKLAKFGELELWDSLLGINSDIMGLAPCNKDMVEFTINMTHSDKNIFFCLTMYLGV